MEGQMTIEELRSRYHQVWEAEGWEISDDD